MGRGEHVRKKKEAVLTPWLTPAAARGCARLGPGCLRLFLVAALLVATGCASGAPPPPARRAGEPIAGPVFRFGEDTFAFPNEVRSLNPGREDLYANYCFVMTRGVVQFLKFARFDPSGAKLPADAYAELVRQVSSRSPWEEALPPEERVGIPGYRNLQELSLGGGAQGQAGLGSRV